jgi:hypothetical protein
MDVNGVVRDAADSSLLPGAKVSLYIGEEELAVIPSNDKGEFSYSRAVSYISKILTCQVEKEKYQVKKETHKIEQDEVRLEIKLLRDVPPPKEIEVRFGIKDEAGNPLEGVNFTLDVAAEQFGTGRSDKAGLFETTLRPDLEGKTLNYKAELADYELVKDQVKLEKRTSCQITMKKIPIPVKKVPRFDEIWLWIGAFIAVEAIIWGPVGGDRGAKSFFVNNVALIPVTTSVLAFFRPINWKYAVLYIVALQVIALLGCILGGGYRDLGGFVIAAALALIGNAVLYKIISSFRLKRAKRRSAKE